MELNKPQTSGFADISKRTIRIAICLLAILALGNLTVFVWSFESQNLAGMVVHPYFFGLALLFSVIPTFVNIIRLSIWSRFLELGMTLPQIIRVVCGTVIAIALTPSATGGPAIKWAMLVSEKVPAKKANTLLSFQVAEDNLILLPLALSAILWAALSLDGPVLPWSYFSSALFSADLFSGGAAITAIGVVLLALLVTALTVKIFGLSISDLRAKIAAAVSDLVSDWRKMWRTGKHQMAVCLALAAVQWIARFSIAASIFAAFGAKIGPAFFWLLQWLTQMVSSLVPTPGGSGGAEAAFLAIHSPFVNGDILLPSMALWRFFSFYLPLGLAALSYLILRDRFRARE